MKKMIEIIKKSGVIPQSEPMKLTLMIGILLVLVSFYGMIPSPYRFIFLPFLIVWYGWFFCRLVIYVVKGISNIVRGIG